MTCREFADILDALFEGTLAEADRTRALAHASGCARCEALLRLMREGASETDEGALDAILSATARVRCEDLLDTLVSFVDGELEPAERDLVDAHVAHCPECRRVAVRLRQVDEWLARSGAVDPGEGFLREVLARTTARTRAVPMWIKRWTARPFFAMEVAYVATALIVFVLGPASPSQPLDAVEQAVLAPGELWQREREAQTGVFGDVARFVEQVSSRGRSATGAAAGAAGHVRDATKHAIRGDVDDAVWQLTMVGGDLEKLWQALSSGVTASKPTTPERVAE